MMRRDRSVSEGDLLFPLNFARRNALKIPEGGSYPFFVNTTDSIGRFKVVVIGDKGCGKTSLLNAFVNKTFEYDQSLIFESSVTTLHFGTKTVDFVMWDLSGCNDYDGFRYGLYEYTDLFLICFDVANKDTLNNVTENWIPEISCVESSIPFLLVGCKSDLRVTSEIKPIKKSQDETTKETSFSTKEEAERTALRWGAKDYVECCAKTGHNVTTVFRTAAQVLANMKFDDKQQQSNSLKLGLTFPKFTKRKSAELGEILHHHSYSLTTVNNLSRRSSTSS